MIPHQPQVRDGERRQAARYVTDQCDPAVAEVEDPLDLAAFDEADGAGPFTLDSPARIVGRLDEHPYADMDDDEDDE